MRMQLSVAFLSLALLPVCKTRDFRGSFSAQSAAVGPGLDVRDVSILFPPPSRRFFSAVLGYDKALELYRENPPKAGPLPPLNHLLERGFWPRLVQDLPEQSFLTAPQFDDIVAEVPGYDPQTRRSRITSIGPLQTASTGSLEHRPINLLDPKRWRVVSVRFAPCSHELSKDRSSLSAESGARLLQDPRLRETCHPELRVVAQPVVGLSGFESGIAASMPVGHSNQEHLEHRDAVASDHWGFADAALHLFYELGPSQAQVFARELSELKRRYQDVCPTSGLPLGVHPCLTQEALGQGPDTPKLGYLESQELTSQADRAVLPAATPENRRKWRRIGFASELRVLMHNHAKPEKNLRRVAVMLSKQLRTPWMFMQFEAKSNRGVVAEPVRLQLALIPVLDPKAQQVSSTAAQASRRTGPQGTSGAAVVGTAARNQDDNGGDANIGGDAYDAEVTARQELQRSSNRAMMNFEQRRFFVVPRSQGVAGGLQVSGAPTSDAELSSARLAKRPKAFADSLDIFLRVRSHFQRPEDYAKLIRDPNKYNVHTPKSIEISGERHVDLMRLATRIENPLLNNDFSTDCGSCHFASLEKWNIENDFDASLLREKGPMNTESLARLLAASPVAQVDVSREAMPALAGVTPATSAAYRIIGDVFLSFYVTNQFSIYKDSPQVSNRVANESGVAAYLANQWYLGGARAHPYTCDPVRLQRCFLLRERSRSSLSVSWLASDFSQNDQCFDAQLGICIRD